jgi:DNA-binding CsgD family transcriptional regulator
VVSSSGQVLRGRADECTALQNLVSAASQGGSQVLVLRGEAGTGKTALLDYTVGLAAGFRCVRLAAIESDMELAFSGLHQLCAPLMEHLDELPVPQRNALRVAFGIGVGPTPDRFLVGLAVLGLVAAAAERRPLLCVVDDAQWLDRVSLQTLGFMARRLLAEPVAVVFAVRDPGADMLAGLPEIRIGGLSDDQARELLNSLLVAKIDPRVRDRIVAETRGNPLALHEVARGISADPGGAWAVSTPQSSPSQVEEGFARRIAALPEQTRLLLLSAAADPLGDSALFLRVAAKLGIPVHALAPAESAGLLEFGPRMRFLHPLMRSAAYRTADLQDRRAIHRALSEATDPHTDPDRRAWHAANAASGPDDAVAAELERSAARAYRRGGVAAAATFLERAAVLSADRSLRGSRAIAAAAMKREAALPEAAHELLNLAESASLTALQRAQVSRMRAQMAFAGSRSGATGAPSTDEAAALLLAAAKELERLDDALARETYVEALTAAMYAGRLGDSARLRTIAEAGRAAIGRVAELQRPIDFLLSGLTQRILDGPGTGSADLQAALKLWHLDAHGSEGTAVHWPFPIAQESAAHEMWDDAVLQEIAAEMVRCARDSGALAVLPPALAFRAGVYVYTGDLAAAAALLDEANAITVSIGDTPVKYHSLTLAAWRGVAGDATSSIEAAAANAEARGEGRLLGLARYTAAVLYNGLGRYEEALTAASDCCRYEDLGFYSWCLYELIEAAAHVGDRNAAVPALGRLEERAGTSGTEWGLGALASARALLASDDDADALFQEAISRLDRAGIEPQLARTRLTYGEWLRRSNRRIHARMHLNQAHGAFSKMGAEAFAERARRELIAVGDKVRKTPITAGDVLTAQEAQIARLAADGLTNREIGARLFISTHTVEWHLRKVFVKLGITSRRQLRTTTWATNHVP